MLANISGLGTLWSFKFFEAYDSTVIRNFVEQALADFEAKYSRFKSNSTLSRLNRTKYLANPNPELIELLDIARKYFDLTQGAFNVATEVHQRAQGYDAAYSFKPRPELNPLTLPLANALTFNSREISLHPQASLDFGGLGKGYLIDKLAKALQTKFGLRYFIINGGGDLYVTSNFGQPVKVHLQDPRARNRSLGEISLRNQALGASSPHVRRWGLHTHLLDPANPTRQVTASAFVIAPKAVDADVLATIATLVPEKTFSAIIRDSLEVRFFRID